MIIPFDQILGIVRNAAAPQAAFDALRELGKARLSSRVWDLINTPDCEADVRSAMSWLTRNIANAQPSGVYLGIDTLNERNGSGHNLEIGTTDNSDPAELSMDWAWHCNRYGKKHLIRGVFEAHNIYERFGLPWDDSTLADYLFFFGYSGAVLGFALERIPVRWDSLFVWGFHDGDLAFLARGSPKGMERLARL